MSERRGNRSRPTTTQRAKWMNDRFLRSFWSGLMTPRRKKINLRIGVFQGFMGVIAFIAYALPLMLVTLGYGMLAGRLRQETFSQNLQAYPVLQVAWRPLANARGSVPGAAHPLLWRAPVDLFPRPAEHHICGFGALAPAPLQVQARVAAHNVIPLAESQLARGAVDPPRLAFQFQVHAHGGFVQHRHAGAAALPVFRAVLLVAEHRAEPQPPDDGRNPRGIGDFEFQLFPALVPGHSRPAFVGDGGEAAGLAHPQQCGGLAQGQLGRVEDDVAFENPASRNGKARRPQQMPRRLRALNRQLDFGLVRGVCHGVGLTARGRRDDGRENPGRWLCGREILLPRHARTRSSARPASSTSRLPRRETPSENRPARYRGPSPRSRWPAPARWRCAGWRPRYPAAAAHQSPGCGPPSPRPSW